MSTRVRNLCEMLFGCCACKRRELEQRRTGGVEEQKLSYRGVGKSVGIPTDFRRATLEFSGRIRGSNEGEHVAQRDPESFRAAPLSSRPTRQKRDNHSCYHGAFPLMSTE